MIELKDQRRMLSIGPSNFGSHHNRILPLIGSNIRNSSYFNILEVHKFKHNNEDQLFNNEPNHLDSRKNNNSLVKSVNQLGNSTNNVNPIQNKKNSSKSLFLSDQDDLEKRNGNPFYSSMSLNSLNYEHWNQNDKQIRLICGKNRMSFPQIDHTLKNSKSTKIRAPSKQFQHSKIPYFIDENLFKLTPSPLNQDSKKSKKPGNSINCNDNYTYG